MDNFAPGLRPFFIVADALVAAAHEAAKNAAQRRATRRHPERGATLRPGADTPLWNALASEARRLLHRRGEKANLARYLGLPRQRLHQFLMERSAGPDAERTLLLLIWVNARRRGLRLS